MQSKHGYRFQALAIWSKHHNSADGALTVGRNTRVGQQLLIGTLVEFFGFHFSPAFTMILHDALLNAHNLNIALQILEHDTHWSKTYHLLIFCRKDHKVRLER